MSLPNFLIVGAMKCGTSTLKGYLQLHDNIFMVPREIHFFDRDSNYRRGIKWYEEFFRGASHQKAVGEKTPNYCYGPSVPGRIHEYLPQAKLIWIFRDPVARAYSHYWHFVRRGRELSSFESALTGIIGADQTNENNYEGYLKVGVYAEQVSRYLEFFPKDQMQFLLLEDLVSDPESTVKRVFNFLGVDPDMEIKKRVKQNVGFMPRSAYLNWTVRRLFKLSVADALLEKINQSFARPKYPPMKEQTRVQLKRYYERPNSELAKLIGINLSAWG